MLSKDALKPVFSSHNVFMTQTTAKMSTFRSVLVQPSGRYSGQKLAKVKKKTKNKIGKHSSFNTLKAKKKPIDIYSPDDLDVDITPRVKTLKVVPPAEREAGIVVETIEELVDKLKNEAKVI